MTFFVVRCLLLTPYFGFRVAKAIIDFKLLIVTHLHMTLANH